MNWEKYMLLSFITLIQWREKTTITPYAFSSIPSLHMPSSVQLNLQIIQLQEHVFVSKENTNPGLFFAMGDHMVSMEIQMDSRRRVTWEKLIHRNSSIQLQLLSLNHPSHDIM